jgi:hypothetical protein
VIRAWWPRSPAPGNLGDVLTPVLLEALGVPVRFAALDRADLLGVGSIIRFAMPQHTVWGSGAMRKADAPSPEARYLAVRGPLTRDVVLAAGGDCPEVYGDPAMLLPLIHDRPVPKTHGVGLVTHYIDRDDPQVRAWKGRTIDPIRSNPLDVVDEIRACHSIVSSSLHGLIVAHAYGIPAAWVRFGDRLTGDDIKFRDHAAALGTQLRPAIRIEGTEPVLGSLDTRPLLDALDALR